MRGTIIPALATALLGTVALAAPVLANDSMPHAWSSGQSNVLAQEQAQSFRDQATATRLAAGRDCLPADTAAATRPGVLPARMVMRDLTGAVVVTRWTYPAPDGSEVYFLCYGS